MATPKHYLETLRLAIGASEPAETLHPVHARELTRLRLILSHPNVVGLGVSEKTVAAARVGPLGLTFYVRRKRPASRVPHAHRIPAVVAAPNGRAIFTDVFEIGDVRPQVSAQHNPIAPGFSVGHANGGPGTLGAIVQRGGKAMILSNAHILALSGAAAIGDPLLYPAAADGGANPADCAARLSSFVDLQSGGDFVNRVDAALGEIIAARLGQVVSAIPGAAAPVVLADPVREMRVALHGRSSGATHSVIRDADAAIQMVYPDLGLVGFYQQVLCDPYTEGGDSGALVIDQATGAVVGLHFAASALGSYFTPIKAVAAALKFSF
jgi:hypothetical protein